MLLLALACCAPNAEPVPIAPSAAPAPSSSEPTPVETVEPEPAPFVPAVLVSHKLMGRFQKATIRPYLEAGVEIDNGYAVYEIQYMSQGHPVGATVTLPIVPTPAQGFHVVVNSHGTTGVADVCAITGTTWGIGLAGEFGARGLIGIAPDYEGLGTPGVHPYLVTKSEGRSALDALRAVEDLATLLKWKLSHRYAVVGLSQGGHAALAAASEHASYAPELDVRAFAAAGPASVRAELWKDAMTFAGEHVVYHALVFYAWTRVYGGPSPLLVDESIFESTCAASPFTSTPTFKDRLPQEPSALFRADFLQAYATGEWGAYPSIGAAFAENRVKPFKQTAPLRIYQGDADSIVPEAHTAAMVADLRAGGVAVEYVVVPQGEHINVAFGFVAQKQLRTADALAWLKTQLDR